jgi:hypothetical protein
MVMVLGYMDGDDSMWYGTSWWCYGTLIRSIMVYGFVTCYGTYLRIGILYYEIASFWYWGACLRHVFVSFGLWNEEHHWVHGTFWLRSTWRDTLLFHILVYFHMVYGMIWYMVETHFTVYGTYVVVHGWYMVWYMCWCTWLIHGMVHDWYLEYMVDGWTCVDAWLMHLVHVVVHRLMHGAWYRLVLVETHIFW